MTAMPYRLLTLLAAALSCTAAAAQPNTPQPASAATEAAQCALLATLPMTDTQAFADAELGLIESFGDQIIAGPTRPR
jgi:alkyl sulfatase BDS1-like metallo-beta-lactamase superfamily hydrolase